MPNSTSNSLDTTIRILASEAKKASRPVARASANQRTQAIEAIAKRLLDAKIEVEEANAIDLQGAKESGLSSAMCDRLKLNGQRIDDLALALRKIAEIPDPVGKTSRSWKRENGLEVSKVRLPLGVILMIYESRPNVTLDAAALCIRSGNVAILRGGSEASQSNRVLNEIVQQGLLDAGLPHTAVQLTPTQDRRAIDILLSLDEDIDLVIPRGGEKLIRHVAQNSRIPVVQHYKGICHVYIDGDANQESALAIAENSKVQRPGVCNAMETLLIDERIAKALLPRVVEQLRSHGVEIRGCETSCSVVPTLKQATPEDWDSEYLELILALRVVKGVDAAIEHIDTHGTNHTAAIITENTEVAEKFTRTVDASCVLINASTRFNDGGELGLGAEMGISTTRIHAYGPMGVEALTAEKYVVYGDGQIRP